MVPPKEKQKTYFLGFSHLGGRESTSAKLGDSERPSGPRDTPPPPERVLEGFPPPPHPCAGLQGVEGTNRSVEKGGRDSISLR